MNAMEMFNMFAAYIDNVYSKFDMTHEYMEFTAWHMFKQNCNMTHKLAHRIAKKLEKKYPSREGYKVLHPTKQNLFAILNGDLEEVCI